MKELTIVNIWERRISNAIKTNQSKDDFPQLNDYGISREDFDDYVIEKQYLLSRMESRKNSLVVPGAILILPVIVTSMFTDSVIGLFGSLAVGVALASAYVLAMDAIDKNKLHRMYDAKIEKYIDAVVNY